MRETAWSVTKGALESEHGIVVCQQVKAARAGALMLESGGNAMDAAVAAAMTLSVVEPWLSGLGGGGFMVCMNAGGQSRALDFGMVSPRGLDVGRYRLVEGDDGDWFRWPRVEGGRNLHGYESIAVPGAVAGLAEALRSMGTMPWREVLEPAISEAREGLEIDWFAALALAMDAETINRYPEAAKVFLREGRAPVATDGARLPLPEKTAFLERLREAGPEDFYTGELAATLVRELREGGCSISMDDMRAYRAEWKTPLQGLYRGWDLHVMPGMSAGPTLLGTLQKLELALPAPGRRGKPGLKKPGPDEVLLYCRLIRAAYEERLRTMGHASTGPNEPDLSCTSNLCVVDRSGMMVVLTNTLLSRFGSRVVVPSLGLLMNNGLMWFDPRPGQPNSLAAGVKPLSNMSPVVLSRGGRPCYGFGAAGGRTIFPTLLQIMSYVIDFGMSLEEAFHFPRVDASTGTIVINRRTDQAVIDRLTEVFSVRVVDDTVYPTRFSQPSAVERDWISGRNRGMAHHNSPWAAAVEGRQA